MSASERPSLRQRRILAVASTLVGLVSLALLVWTGVNRYVIPIATTVEGNEAEARWTLEREFGKRYSNVTAESRIHVSATSEEGTREWSVERLALLSQVLDEQRALMTVTSEPPVPTMQKGIHVVGDRGLILAAGTTYDAKSARALVREVAHATSLPSEVQKAYEAAQVVAFSEGEGLRFASVTADPERLGADHFLNGLLSEVTSCEVRCGFDADGHLARCEIAVEGLSSAYLEPAGSMVSLTWDTTYRDYGYTRVPDLGKGFVEGQKRLG